MPLASHDKDSRTHMTWTISFSTRRTRNERKMPKRPCVSR